MGGDASKSLPPLPDGNYMSISTTSKDSLYLMYCSKIEIEVVRNAIISSWSKGIQNEEFLGEEDKDNPKNFNCLKFKLKGRPFCTSSGRDQSLECRVMATAILDALYNCGWKLIVLSDQIHTLDFCFWLFEKQEIESDSKPMFSIGLASTNKLQLNDCPQYLHGIIKQSCEATWTKGVQSEDVNEKTYEIEVKGSPWDTSNKEESCSARLMVKEIIQKLSSEQYYLYGSANLRGHSDTLFFKYNQHQVETNYSLISVNISDLMRLIKFPESICEQVKETAIQYWPKGIQDVNVDESCYELKLKGKPWARTIDKKVQVVVNARIMVTKIMEKLASLGYLVTVGLTVSRDVNDKSVFLFRQGEPVTAPFMCVSLNFEDQVQFIGAPEDVIESVKPIFQQWPKGIQEEKNQHDGLSYHVKLKGAPWTMFDIRNSGDGVRGQALLVGLLTQIKILGWSLVCSGDLLYKYDGQKQKADYSVENHCYWFMKQ